MDGGSYDDSFSLYVSVLWNFGGFEEWAMINLEEKSVLTIGKRDRRALNRERSLKTWSQNKKPVLQGRAELVETGGGGSLWATVRGR